MLRAEKGREFQLAAKRYDALKVGRVYFEAKAQMKDQLGQQIYGLAPVGKDGDVWLVGEQSKGDFLSTAVHESKHLEGHRHDQNLTQSVYNAWMELSPQDHEAATTTAKWLFEYTNGQVGTNPIPPSKLP